jgi:hypothetical protein
MKTKRKLKQMFGLFGIMLLPISSITAQSWNSADDFSAVNNPNGVWQYGYETTLGGAFTLYDLPFTPVTGLNNWSSSSIGVDPNVLHNASASPVAIADFVIQPNQTSFHPGPNGEFSIYRWTAPTVGTFSIQADFVGLGTSSTTDLHILIDGISIFNGEINGPGMTTAFDTTQLLTAGSIVDFAVGFGRRQLHLRYDRYQCDDCGCPRAIVTRADGTGRRNFGLEINLSPEKQCRDQCRLTLRWSQQPPRLAVSMRRRNS